MKIRSGTALLRVGVVYWNTRNTAAAGRDVYKRQSMLQMGNIVKNPRIWIAPTLASAITGPLATCVFHFEMNGAAVSSGMGTCGLVGQIRCV